MAVKQEISKNSPKNKYRATITYDKSLKEIGSVSSTLAMSISQLKRNVKFFTDQAKKSKVGSHVQIFENKKKYPEFDWVKKSSFKVQV